jgi:hypothetical protein
MTDHHDESVWVEALHCPENVGEQGLAGDAVQYFGLGRTHALAQAGCENHYPK